MYMKLLTQVVKNLSSPSRIRWNWRKLNWSLDLADQTKKDSGVVWHKTCYETCQMYSKVEWVGNLRNIFISFLSKFWFQMDISHPVLSYRFTSYRKKTEALCSLSSLKMLWCLLLTSIFLINITVISNYDKTTKPFTAFSYSWIENFYQFVAESIRVVRVFRVCESRDFYNKLCGLDCVSSDITS